jgi:hypothetical protein
MLVTFCQGPIRDESVRRMDATVKPVDLDRFGGVRGKVSTPSPRFKNRTWGTLRVSSDYDREKLTYAGHPPFKFAELSTV